MRCIKASESAGPVVSQSNQVRNHNPDARRQRLTVVLEIEQEVVSEKRML